MIYLDNASTSFPKAPLLSSAIKEFIDTACFNINRGGYSDAKNVSELVFDTREMLSSFFSSPSGKNVVFTGGLTTSLNIVLKGLLKPCDTVLTSTMEHNSVMRPLSQLEEDGVIISYFNSKQNGEVDFEDFALKAKKKPKLVVVTHASNVCGTIMPIKEMGAICKREGIIFVVDSAQTAGVIDINLQRDNIDVLCFTSHKGLLSAQGLGGIITTDKIAALINPIISGGTGSFSSKIQVPHVMPDKLEAGTLNLPGIVGLNVSLKYIKERGLKEIFNAEKCLQNYFEAEVAKIENIKIVGGDAAERCAVTSLDFLTIDNGEAAMLLDEEFGILTRSGLHCAPNAHRTINSFPRGTVRFSFGHMNTEKEVETTIKAIRKISTK